MFEITLNSLLRVWSIVGYFPELYVYIVTYPKKVQVCTQYFINRVYFYVVVRVLYCVYA